MGTWENCFILDAEKCIKMEGQFSELGTLNTTFLNRKQ